MAFWLIHLMVSSWYYQLNGHEMNLTMCVLTKYSLSLCDTSSLCVSLT